MAARFALRRASDSVLSATEVTGVAVRDGAGAAVFVVSTACSGRGKALSMLVSIF